MPAFAKDHERALTRIALCCLFLGNLGKLSLDAAAFVVVVFELRCKTHAFSGVVAEKQIERKLSIAHAPCRIEPRNERETKVHRTQGAGLYACLDHERFNAGTRFASTMGIRSAIVPSVARSTRLRQRCGLPSRAPKA